MIKAVYYQRVKKVSDAPGDYGNITSGRIYVPNLDVLLMVDRSAPLDITEVQVVDEKELAEARQVYRGAKKLGSVRFEQVKMFEYDQSITQRFLRDIHTIERLQDRATADLEALMRLIPQKTAN